MSNIDSLHKSCRELEQRLHEVSEEKRRVETESTRQREALHKMQDREQDLSKDIETLRDENSHHSGTISRLQVHRVCVCFIVYSACKVQWNLSNMDSNGAEESAMVSEVSEVEMHARVVLEVVQ